MVGIAVTLHVVMIARPRSIRPSMILLAKRPSVESFRR